MGMFGALSGSLTGAVIAQDLDLGTVELFSHFFSVTEMITDLQFADLSVKELTILKGALLLEVARQIAQRTARDAVRGRVREIVSVLRPPGEAK
jgi:hypothetical protein